MIDPTAVSTIRVGELSHEPFSLTDNVPHEVGTELKRGTIEDLATFISAFIGSTDGVGFRAISVTDGQTLPTTTQQEFILVGKGTYYNVVGGSTIICTEELNAIVSNGSYWFIGVEIPVNVELAGITQFIRDGFINTTPSEDAVYEALALKANVADSENIANKQNDLTPDGTGTKYPTVDAVNVMKSRTNNLDASNLNYVGLGDSITRGVGSTDGVTSYMDIMNDNVGFKTMTKLAVSGATAMPSQGRDELSFQVALIPAGTDLITVMIGVNDWDVNNIVGDMDAVMGKTYISLDKNLSFIEAFRYNLETIKRNFPDAKIFVITPLKTSTGWIGQYDFKYYIDAQITVANYLSIPVINAYSNSGIYRDSSTIPDGLHPNDAGYKLIADLVLSNLISPNQESFSNKFQTVSTENINVSNDINVSNTITWGSVSPSTKNHITLYNGSTSDTKIGIGFSNDTNNLSIFALSNYSILFGQGTDTFNTTLANSKLSIFGNSGNIGINQPSDNGVDRLQVNGSIYSQGSVTATNFIGNWNGYTYSDSNIGNTIVKRDSSGDVGLRDLYVNTVYATSYIGSASLTGTPTAPTATVGTNTTQIATTAFVQGIRPYKVYTALLSQTGTNAPTAIVLENTLGGTPVWTRTSAGSYVGTLAGAFVTDKTVILYNASSSSFSSFVKLNTVNNTIDWQNGADDRMLNNGTMIEIRVYN